MLLSKFKLNLELIRSDFFLNYVVLSNIHLLVLTISVLQETLEALKELSTFFTDNSLQSRRNLRNQIEKRSLTINENFLSEFREVKNALDDVYNIISQMSDSVKDMSKLLENTKIQTKSLIEQANNYQTGR